LRSRAIVCFIFSGLIFCLSLSNTLAGDIDTAVIYAEKCALCHGEDGKGTPTGIVLELKISPMQSGRVHVLMTTL
jgi:mono/diheme cytochrome c family protein